MPFRVGDEVIANRQIGGIVRSEIPKGARGVVVSAGMAQPLMVAFVINGMFRSKKVRVSVEPSEISQA